MPPYRALVKRSGEDRGKPYFLKNASRLQPGTGKGPQRHCQPKQLRNNPRGCFNAPKFSPTPPNPLLTITCRGGSRGRPRPLLTITCRGGSRGRPRPLLTTTCRGGSRGRPPGPGADTPSTPHITPIPLPHLTPISPPSHLPHIPPKHLPQHPLTPQGNDPSPTCAQTRHRARNPLPGPARDPYNGAQPAPNGLSHPSVIPVKTGIPPSAAPYGPN